MKERPILFNGAMVRALLAGDKTQTRRIVKPQPPEDETIISGLYHPTIIDCHGEEGPGAEVFGAYTQDGEWAKQCPHGQPGDRLWVRETFQPFYANGVEYPNANWETGAGYAPTYPATDGIREFVDPDDNVSDRCWPSIHMPRWASRILLEVTAVRVERLQDISDADILAEGIDTEKLAKSQDSYDIVCKGTDADGRATLRTAWRDLWESTGGDWEANPWVWVVEFKRIDGA